MPGQRQSRDSRCSQPSGAPYHWVGKFDAEHPSVMRYEEHFAAMHPPTRAILKGEIEELFEAAANGEIEESSDDRLPLKPIVTDPEIWELRVRKPAEYRFYHGEPPRFPKALVRLHKHIKDDSSLQQDEIDYAISRYYP